MLTRRAHQTVAAALARQAAVALLGPRQVGKTTLAVAIAETTNSLYLDLESAGDRQRLAEPRLFLQEYADRLVVLDEIHRAPALFPELRGVIDSGRRAGNRTGRFLILGSASTDLLRQAGESLAGRIEYVPLDPFDVLDVPPDTASTTQHWVRGGFPDSLLATSEVNSLAFRRNLIRTYLDRDIAEFTGRRLPAETLSRLWTMLAHSQGTALNASKLAGSLGVSGPTVTHYVDLLVESATGTPAAALLREHQEAPRQVAQGLCPRQRTRPRAPRDRRPCRAGRPSGRRCELGRVRRREPAGSCAARHNCQLLRHPRRCGGRPRPRATGPSRTVGDRSQTGPSTAPEPRVLQRP